MAVARKFSVLKEDRNWKKQWTFSAASTMPKLTSKQKCVQEDEQREVAITRKFVLNICCRVKTFLCSKMMEIGKKNGTLPKLASKQKCVQDNSSILADERKNVDGSQHLCRRACGRPLNIFAETGIKTIVT
jgi:hypothetical protein